MSHSNVASSVIENVEWRDAHLAVPTLDEAGYAALRRAYGQLLVEMPGERALFDPEQLKYWVRVQIQCPDWMRLQQEVELLATGASGPPPTAPT